MSGQTFDAGLPVIAEDLTNIVYQNEDGVSTQAVSSGTDTTTSASYANMAGTGSTTSFTFTKVLASTRVKVEIDASWTAVTNTAQIRVGALVNGTDYDCAGMLLTAAAWGTVSGFAIISGLAAGAYTIQARWKRPAGTGTATRDTNAWLALSAAEIT